MPYYISSHPGSDLHAMIDLAIFLKACSTGYRPDQVQDFIPAPVRRGDVQCTTQASTQFSKQEVYVAR